MRYLKPEDCDSAESADRKYGSFSCMPAPGGGNECIGGGTGGQFTDCKQCLLNCSNNPGGGDVDTGDEPSPDVVPSESIPFQQTTTGKVVISGAVIIIVILVVLIIVKMMRHNKSVAPLSSSFEQIMWRRK